MAKERWVYKVHFGFRINSTTLLLTDQGEFEFDNCLSAKEMELDIKEAHNFYEVTVFEWELLKEGVAISNATIRDSEFGIIDSLPGYILGRIPGEGDSSTLKEAMIKA